MTQGFFFSFEAIYSRQAGISTSLIGVGIMVGSFSQIPFMVIFDRIYKRFGLVKLLVCSGMVFGLRWLLYSTVLSSGTILLLWAMHGFNYIIVYLCLIEYVSTNIPKELHTRGQMMNTIILSGISVIVGSYFGGMISTYIGLRQVFFACAVVCFLVVPIFLVLSMRLDLYDKCSGKDVK